MRINSLSNNSGGKEQKNIAIGDKRGIAGIEPSDFSKALSGANQKSDREDLEYLMQEINKRAEKLAKSCTIQDLKSYKRSVREFLKETIGKAYKAHDEAGWDGLGKHKVFVLIKKVDEKLEELTYEVLREQEDSLELLNRLDEIRGLLVDLYL